MHRITTTSLLGFLLLYILMAVGVVSCANENRTSKEIGGDKFSPEIIVVESPKEIDSIPAIEEQAEEKIVEIIEEPTVSAPAPADHPSKDLPTTDLPTTPTTPITPITPITPTETPSAQTNYVAVEQDSADQKSTNNFLLALKSNLLFDAIATPNIEIEFPFSDNRYSAMAEVWFPWYVWDNNSKAYQLFYGGLELRRWLGDRTKRDALTGHHIGIYAGAGYYDLEWDSEGYQGEFYIAAGLSYGYSFKLNNSLRLEAGIGIGFMKTDYRHYHAEENGKFLVWQHDGRHTWIGPTKAKLSLVWILGNKKGGSK